jgi:hypothetical protein
MSLLNRRDVLRVLLREREKMIIVAGLGTPAYDLPRLVWKRTVGLSPVGRDGRGSRNQSLRSWS